MKTCAVCRRQYANSRSLASHKYKLHRTEDVSKRESNLSEHPKLLKWICRGILYCLPLKPEVKSKLKLKRSEILKIAKLRQRDVITYVKNNDLSSLCELLSTVPMDALTDLTK